ncbi:TrmH family RNA methyltransferase [Flavobacterium sp.]
MVSKNQIKLINSLQQKKYRIEHQLFIAEGVKVIQELLQSKIVLEQLFATEESFSSFECSSKTAISQQEMKKISVLSTPSSCLALFKIPKQNKPETSGLIVALDAIRDPGNLGTIVRLCDWFGCTQIICATETVDLYNPKVVQATMGSIARVIVNYVDLKDYLNESSLPVFGTFMDGKNIYKEKLPNEGIIVFGNEANGISAEIEKIIKNRIAIPQFGTIHGTESLNVATATAIVLSEFSRGN